jgi:hypothetical protein
MTVPPAKKYPPIKKYVTLKSMQGLGNYVDVPTYVAATREKSFLPLRNNPFVCYQTGFAVDTDGAPNCYGPSTKGNQGSPPALDQLSNGGHGGNWWGLDPKKAASEQGLSPNRWKPTKDYLATLPWKIDSLFPSGQDFYVSTTYYEIDRQKKQPSDQSRYVDAFSIPYISLIGTLFKIADLTDFYIVVNLQHPNRIASAIVADTGGTAGEGSVALGGHWTFYKVSINNIQKIQRTHIHS